MMIDNTVPPTAENPEKPPKIKLKKAITSKQFLEKKFDTLAFDGEWKERFGEPEDNFSMIIYGPSANGKTEGEVQICKYLATFGKVYFNSNEQGISRSLQTSWIRNEMQDSDVILVHKESYEHMLIRLKRQKSPKIIFIDSIQHTKLTYEKWLTMRAMFPKKIFVLISHAEGVRPQGADAKKIEFDVDIKCQVKDFVLYPAGRFGGGKPMIIYERGYLERLDRKKGKKLKTSKQKKT